jgi:hypothetical protein
MPGDLGATVVDLLAWFLFFPRKAAGVTSIRHSPRPLWAELKVMASGALRRGRVETCPHVMAALVAAIHVFSGSQEQDVDARHKAGHDGRRSRADERQGWRYAAT